MITEVEILVVCQAIGSILVYALPIQLSQYFANLLGLHQCGNLLQPFHFSVVIVTLVPLVAFLPEIINISVSSSL